MKLQIQTFLATTMVLVAGAALADRDINVNANNSDWNGSPTCINQFQNSTGGITLTRACITNNNTSGSNGNMYTLFEADLGWYSLFGAGFGFAIDLDGDGHITAANDEVYAVIIPTFGTGGRWALNVYAPGTYDRPKRTYSAFAECGGSAGANGWTAAWNGGRVIEFGISYGCIRLDGTGPALTHGADNRKVFLGSAPELHLTTETYYDGTNDTIYQPGTKPPDVNYPTLTSGNGRARVVWTNPAAHEGTLVLRYDGALWPRAGAFKPTNGTRYSVGQIVGGGAYTVVFADRHGQGNSVVDSGLSNSNRYAYRVFNHNAGFTYADGQVPSDEGVLGTPTSQTNGAPLWCYSTSVSTLNQPAPDGTGGVFSSGNAGLLVSMQSNSGDEVWRPYDLTSAVQNRFPIVPLKDRPGRWMITGTQNGSVAAISTTTGQPAWTSSPSTVGGNYIQSAPAVQLAASSNSAFTSKHSGDLIFVATRVKSDEYSVVALRAADGRTAWSRGKMPPVSGGMLVDYSQNRLYVPTMDSKSGSLKILSTLDGTVEGTVSVGPVSTGVVKDFFWNNNEGQAIVVNDSGIAYGIGLGWPRKSNPAIAWQGPVGGSPAGSPMPLKGGFLVSTKGASGAVKMFAVTAGRAPVQEWSTPIPNPSGPSLRISNGYYTEVWVGAESRLQGLEFSTGSPTKQVITGSTRAGVPVIDNTGRIYAGLMDGRICAWNLP